ncbi:hypothetical protein GCM10014715_22500 [Streptomyces spiralis]|uniref:Uncharacterized protein n=1 Tax=Streptomyces spiralis TaxID=66376 RepID=A0A919DP58_9ACTN|nr:hypothetical protein [Streptomyces spiralis]GHE68314.1 hypothetical protein GCM10014715_22500 [Streptomyces spiralis]
MTGRDHGCEPCRHAGPCGAGTASIDPATGGGNVDPGTGEGFDAPVPRQAYANAPCLRREMHEVLALGAERDGRQARSVTAPPRDALTAERLLLLRRAALMDRMALDAPGTDAVGAAIRTAEELVLYDRRHPDLVAGPHRPDSVEFDLGRRPYVRQEYAAWSAAGFPAG